MSFRLQINLILIAVTLCVGIGTLWFFKIEQERVIHDNIEAQADAISKLIAEDLAKMVYLNDPDISTDITRRIQSINNLYTAYFFDNENHPILIINPTEQRILHYSTAIDTKISFEGVPLGVGHFIFDNVTLAQETERLQNFAITLLVLLIFVTLVFIHFLDNRFIRRLSELSYALRKVAQDQDFEFQLTICRQDEIGEVRQHFNELVSQVHQHTQQLKYEAHHDALTGLYNRNYLNEIIHQTIADNTYNALCYIDLDQFKVINETLGHATGDQLIKRLSNFIQEFFNEEHNTLLARIGGDEFILLIQQTSELEAKRLAETLKSQIKQFKYIHNNKTYRIGVSIGLIHYNPLSPNHTNLTATQLLSAADTACHHAKAEGRDKLISYQIGDQGLAQAQNTMNLISVITTALEKNQFELYLQPIIPTHNTQVLNHFETLIRLQKADGQMIPPSIFIPIAEKYGLSKKIDLWVVTELLKHLASSADFCQSLHVITINLSADSLMDSKFKNKLDQVLHNSQVPLNKLCFEVTETGSISNFLKVRDFIHHFKKLGCSFALDDFGTGMASFEYLSELPVDYLKIDGSFVKNIAHDPVMKEMVIAMNQIGHITQTQVIAEFVENQEIVKVLQAIGVDYLQGYYFSKPFPITTYLVDNC